LLMRKHKKQFCERVVVRTKVHRVPGLAAARVSRTTTKQDIIVVGLGDELFRIGGRGTRAGGTRVVVVVVADTGAAVVVTDYGHCVLAPTRCSRRRRGGGRGVAATLFSRGSIHRGGSPGRSHDFLVEVAA
jgi:hypothetical protein